MANIKFHLVTPNDNQTIELIANWYLNEWHLPIDKTILRLQTITADPSQFQVLMTLDNVPVSTGGIYSHVGLLDREPKFKVFKNWLALVYTTPDKRQQGYGAAICNYIQDYSKHIGLDKIHLFTDTAERLYKRLGWDEIERLNLGERHIVVMKKDQLNDEKNGYQA